MNTALLDVQVSNKSHGRQRVLADLEFSVQSGEIVAILGTSGCGKSTLLRLIAGLDSDFQGRIRHDAGRTGFVFQEPRLMPWLTVEDNIGFILGKGQASRARIKALLDEVGLSHAAGFYPKQLSGGMAQRAAIARALVHQPDLLLLDEPFSALDVLTRGRLHRLVHDLVRKYGMGAVFVTHDPSEALALASRVLVMDGRPGPFREQLRVPPFRGDGTHQALHEKIVAALSHTPQETYC